jgi:hypothetical protein
MVALTIMECDVPVARVGLGGASHCGICTTGEDRRLSTAHNLEMSSVTAVGAPHFKFLNLY